MRRRQLKRLWARLKQLSTMRLTREGTADETRRRARSVTHRLALGHDRDCRRERHFQPFSYRLDRNKLRQTRLREGRYLLRTNLVEEDPAKLWSHYLLLGAVEEAFRG
jgi:hypothetical protein